MSSQTDHSQESRGFTPRRVLIVGYSYDAPEVAQEVAQYLELKGIASEQINCDPWGKCDHDDCLLEIARDKANSCDLAIVLGGDGSFLRAADLAHSADIPLIGINMGHVGFLAEREIDGIWDALDRIIAGKFTIKDQMTIDVSIVSNDVERAVSWAFNELSVTKTTHRGVLEATLAVDNRPVSGYACDGILVATPSGSTAYAFSAGGPVLWPETSAMVVVPSNAHGLFTRPLVLSPESIVTVDVNCAKGGIIASLDGFREIDVRSGDRILARAGHRPVRVIRLDARPFADKLVRKFHLPVKGWRDGLRHTLPTKHPQ